MIKILENIKNYLLVFAAITGIGLSIYSMMLYGIFNTTLFGVITLLLAIVLQLIIKQMINKREQQEPKVSTYSMELRHGFPRTWESCEPGFFLYNETLCYKNEYNESFIISSGEMFWGGTHTDTQRDQLIVTPLFRE